MHLDGCALRDIGDKTNSICLIYNTNIMPKPDYLLYLVTDSTMVPENCTFLGQVQQAVDNGATIVQLREKSLSTLDFVERAKQVLAITRPKNIPLIINDRIDVALAVDADGVHVGQDDMPAAIARKLIGPDKILGVSCTNEQETLQVCTEGVADYVGLGTVYPTKTKDVKNVCGPIGVRRLLQVLKAHPNVSCVAIGGINHTNAAKVLFQCQVADRKVDGVAVVSCIMAAADAGDATKRLVDVMKAPPKWCYDKVPLYMRREVTKLAPLVHHITNNVVKNFCANVTLAVGGSPIMSELPEEFDEFAALPGPGALVVNMGTPTAQLMEVFLEGIRAYNSCGKPVVFDPVAAGASKARLAAAKTLLNAGHFAVIKGNLGEIAALDKLTSEYDSSSANITMVGVDSAGSVGTQIIEAMGRRVSAEFKAVVVVTGELNYIVDATGSNHTVKTVMGGGKIMASVTGTGCAMGSVIAAYVAGAVHRKLSLAEAVLSAVTHYNRPLHSPRRVQPGLFVPQFIDHLSLSGLNEYFYTPLRGF